MLKNIFFRCIVIFLILINTPFQTMTIVYATDQNISSYVNRPEESDCDIEVAMTNSPDTSGGIGSSSLSASLGDAGGNWVIEGTKENTVAKLLFKILTERYGLSGTSAAGWMGNVQSESGYNLSAVEAENGQNYSGRGYGLFQFTPGEKYLNSSFYKRGASLEEEIANQVAFVWNSEFANGAYRSFLPNASAWFGLNGIDTVEDILDNDNVEEATLVFFAVYERGDVVQMHRERRLNAARAANTLFNAENIKADPSKWKFNTVGTTSNTANIYTESGTNIDNLNCDFNGSNDYAVDGTGEVPADAVEWGYKPENLPDSLKPFAHDPEKLGLSYGGYSGWVENSGQCVDFTISCGNAIWGYSGSVISDGWKQAHAWAATRFGNSLKSTPKAGAIFSTGSTPPGHTGIVSHVFKNGDILIIEQNTPLSGINFYGKINTWNYRIYRVAEQKADGMVFAYPDNKEPNWGN